MENGGSRLRIGRREYLKLLGLGAGAVAAGPALVGCSQGGGGGTAANGRKVVNFMATSMPSQTTTLAKFVQLYNDSQSSYQVNLRELPTQSSSTEVHQQLVQTLDRADGSIDAFMLDIVWVAEFAAAGWSMDLSSSFSATDRKQFFPAVVEACTYEQKLVAMPFVIAAGMLYYRTDLLKAAGLKPPATWSALVEQSRQLTGSGAAKLGFLWQGKQSEALVANAVEFIAAGGGSVFGPDHKTVTIADAPAVEAVQFMYDTINSTKISPRDVLSWDEEPTRRSFWGGSAPFMRMWSSAWLRTQDPSISQVAGKTGLANLPGLRAGLSGSTFGGYQLGIAESSKNKDGALDFLKWIAKPQTAKTFYDGFGYTSAQTGFYEQAGIKGTSVADAVTRQVGGAGVPRPVTPHYAQVSLALQAAVSTAISKGDVKTNLERARSEIERIVAS
ncbi:multiple sugar transport system substrate-binding protein [Kribbella aluminosa]|uniref:Multiple sugar transport system substrate-binding protein n=1 Tax=Kribbella aluminosa TaxID=416017 RepID=A0ABS4UJ46_9ACTN|nr:extracellular solute-binding protein [Kribbella aluminosa]MBP2351672.1 multiple sugar transport system substrate-binding protein [Kribbella aluminosa]